MDEQTIAAYARGAGAYADDWESQPPPSDLHTLVEEFFYPGPTADIGCGSGRDAAWLRDHGFQTTGYDASAEMVEEARRRHPGVAFEHARLPELESVPRAHFANVLCETVLMHLATADIPPSIRSLTEILAPDGTLYLSWRVTADGDERDTEGRLFTAFDVTLVRDALGPMTIVYEEEATSVSSGRTIHRVIARKR